MKTNQKKLFYIIVALQLAFLLVMAGSKTFTLVTGTKILLEVIPVDPRDLFRGNYVALGYKISEYNSPDMEKFKIGSTIYVKLKKTGKYWEIAGVSKSKPELGKDEVYIVGETGCCNSIIYGIEAYFVPEGKGDRIQRSMAQRNINNTSRVSAEVAVDRFGNAVISKLYIDDKPVEF